MKMSACLIFTYFRIVSPLPTFWDCCLLSLTTRKSLVSLHLYHFAINLYSTPSFHTP